MCPEGVVPDVKETTGPRRHVSSVVEDHRSSTEVAGGVRQNIVSRRLLCKETLVERSLKTLRSFRKPTQLFLLNDRKSLDTGT